MNNVTSDDNLPRRSSVHSTAPTKWMKELGEWTKTMVVAFVIVLLLNMFVFQLSTVDGDSMQPTLEDKEWLFVNKAVYLFGHPKLEETVILVEPGKQNKRGNYLVKRIVGVPGDTIEIANSQLYRNGEPISEPYASSPIEGRGIEQITVGEGQYYVLGDNRKIYASKDSRSFGLVSESSIKGRADFIIWPFNKVGGL